MDLESAIIIITFLLWRDQVIQLTIVIASLVCVFPNVLLVMLGFQTDCKFWNLKQWHINETTDWFSCLFGYWLSKQKNFSSFWNGQNPLTPALPASLMAPVQIFILGLNSVSFYL